MDDPTPAPGTAQDAGGNRLGPPPRAPRWVKVFGVIAAAVLLLFVVLLVTGNDHGPGRHLDGGEERAPGVDHGERHP